MEEEGQEGISNLTGKALDIAKQVGRKLLGVGASTELVFLASGGCNHVWLATSSLVRIIVASISITNYIDESLAVRPEADQRC